MTNAIKRTLKRQAHSEEERTEINKKGENIKIKKK